MKRSVILILLLVLIAAFCIGALWLDYVLNGESGLLTMRDENQTSTAIYATNAEVEKLLSATQTAKASTSSDP